MELVTVNSLKKDISKKIEKYEVFSMVFRSLRAVNCSCVVAYLRRDGLFNLSFIQFLELPLNLSLPLALIPFNTNKVVIGIRIWSISIVQQIK